MIDAPKCKLQLNHAALKAGTSISTIGQWQESTYTYETNLFPAGALSVCG